MSVPERIPVLLITQQITYEMQLKSHGETKPVKQYSIWLIVQGERCQQYGILVPTTRMSERYYRIGLLIIIIVAGMAVFNVVGYLIEDRRR